MVCNVILCDTSHNTYFCQVLAKATVPATLRGMTDTPDTDHYRNRGLRDVRRQQAAERRALREKQDAARERRAAARKLMENRQTVVQSNAVIKGMVPRISAAVNS